MRATNTRRAGAAILTIFTLGVAGWLIVTSDSDTNDAPVSGSDRGYEDGVGQWCLNKGIETYGSPDTMSDSELQVASVSFGICMMALGVDPSTDRILSESNLTIYALQQSEACLDTVEYAYDTDISAEYARTDQALVTRMIAEFGDCLYDGGINPSTGAPL
jgi:hypothetical protein